MTKNNSKFLWSLMIKVKIKSLEWWYYVVKICEDMWGWLGYVIQLWTLWLVLSTWNTSQQTSVLIGNFTNTEANLVISSLEPGNCCFSLPPHPSPHLSKTFCSVSPQTRPQVTGLQSHYKPGDTVNISCLCPSSFPAANISWFINGNKVRHSTA